MTLCHTYATLEAMETYWLEGNEGPEELACARLRSIGERLRREGSAVMKEVVGELDECLTDLNQRGGVAPELEELVRHSALSASFSALLLARHGHDRLAWKRLAGEWARAAATIDPDARPLAVVGLADEVAEPIRLHVDRAAEQELLSTFQVAVFERLRESRGGARGREVVRRLLALLGLSYDQLGRALGISGESVRRWERGSHPIPDERLAALARADAALDRLMAMIRPDRLSESIRRPAPLFDGDSALDWILRGRLGEVAGRYEMALTYQG